LRAAQPHRCHRGSPSPAKLKPTELATTEAAAWYCLSGCTALNMIYTAWGKDVVPQRARFRPRGCAERRRQPSQSASARCTNSGVASRPHLTRLRQWRAISQEQPLEVAGLTWGLQMNIYIYKNGAADRALHLIFVSRGSTHSAPRT
jgi:hypothetical protein